MPRLVQDIPFTLSRRMANRLAALAEEMDLSPMTLLLIGDGSGTVYSEHSGWCCTAFDPVRHVAHVHAGAMTCGTNNFAELMPYVQALYHHHSQECKEGAKEKHLGEVNHKVHILTDSELTARCGQGVYARNANGFLWNALTWFKQSGYSLTWHHVPRGSNEWNALADALAGEMRALVAGIKPSLVKELKRQIT